ncbi:MAG: DUF58 domain-containing protein [Acidimicrobiales bacterium]
MAGAPALLRSPKLGLHLGIVVVGLLGALIFSNAALALLVVPFAVSLALGLGGNVASQVSAGPAGIGAAEVEVGQDRLLEGDEIALLVTFRGAGALPGIEVAASVPPGLEVAGTSGTGPPDSAPPGGGVTGVRMTITARRWGVYRLGPLAVRTRDASGYFAWERAFDPGLVVRVYPQVDTLTRLVKPADTQVFAGDHPARAKSTGVEFADLRPFVAGDRARDIDWRASSRRGEPWVAERHPERNADVVLLLDTFTGAALEPAARIVASLASAYARARDRVGVVTFGGTVSWLEPAMGSRQLYRLTEVLLSSSPHMSYAWRDVAVVPPRALPPKALVLAVSCLDDERVNAALADLAGRGRDLVVIEIALHEMLPAAGPVGAGGAGAAVPASIGSVARALWRLQRSAERDRLRALGVPVVEWQPGSSLQGVLGEVSSWRRSSRGRTR